MPEQGNTDIERVLREIREAYAAKLPGRLQEIGDALQQCLDEPGVETHYATLLNHLHSLSGSAGSFGFDELGMRATELEMLLNGFLSSGTAGHDDFAPMVDGVRQMLQEAAKQLPQV